MLASSEARLRAAVQIASQYERQSNELKAWLIALLRKVGPQKMPLSDWERVGVVEGADTVFLVVPDEEDPSQVHLKTGRLEEVMPQQEGPKA